MKGYIKSAIRIQHPKSALLRELSSLSKKIDWVILFECGEGSSLLTRCVNESEQVV